MSEETRQNIEGYLAKHKYMTLATVDRAGAPVAHTVGYVSEGSTVYFSTFKLTRKAENIAFNNAVAYTVDEDYDAWQDIRGVQMRGVAAVVDDVAELERVVGMIIEKFPEFADFGPNPDIAFFRVEPSEGFYLDYSKGLSNMDRVEY